MTPLFIELALLLVSVALASLAVGMLVTRHVAKRRVARCEVAWKGRLVDLNVRRQREAERLAARLHRLERENAELRAVRQAHEDTIRVLRRPVLDRTALPEPMLEDEPFDETLDLDVLAGGRPAPSRLPRPIDPSLTERRVATESGAGSETD